MTYFAYTTHHHSILPLLERARGKEKEKARRPLSSMTTAELSAFAAVERERNDLLTKDVVRHMGGGAIVTFELAGTPRESLQIRTEDDTLTVRATTPQGWEFELERLLPKNLDAEKARATYKDGLLTIEFPPLEVGTVIPLSED